MTTNIATTKEQSVRLLQCGVDPKTADMFYQIPITISQKRQGEDMLLIKKSDAALFDTDTPAWSLSALLGLLPKEIKVDESPYDEVQKYGLLIYPFMSGWQIDYQYCENDECQCLKCVYDTDLIEACVQAIEWLYAPSELDFNVEESEEVTIDGWLTRSVSGNIVFSDSSECRRGNRVWYHKEGANVVDLDETGLFPNNLFPSLTWESDPLEVTITIKPKKI